MSSRTNNEAAVKAIGNRFDLILVASIRTRELNRGHKSKMISKTGNMLTALQEIEEGHIGREYLKKVGR